MKIRINGDLLYFDVDNPGLIPNESGMQELPTMIVLHGGPGYDHTPYKTFFTALHRSVQIIFIDQHGHGRSASGSPETWNFERWSSDIDEFCNTLHINQPIIFGHSFGSQVAMEYAIRYSDNLNKIILCNVIPKFDLEESAQLFLQLGGESAKQAFLNFWENTSDESKQQYALLCSSFYGIQKIDEQKIFYNRLKIKMDVLDYFSKFLAKKLDFLERAHLIKKPTLIISGEKDPIATVKNANLLAQKLGANCYRHIIVPETSHNLIWEKNAAVMNSIKEFINSDEC